MKEKPSLDEVLEYASKQIQIYIVKYASSMPREQQEEMSQTAILRIIEAYDRIEPDKGWKSFTQRHSAGAVLDYIRWGHGFEEQTLEPKAKRDENGFDIEEAEKKPWRLRKRLQLYYRKDGEDGNESRELPLESTLGLSGVFTPEYDILKMRPRWDLLARMSSQDPHIHLVAKLLLGFTQTELSSMFRVSRERLTQRLAEFCKRLDSPEYYNSKWITQTIYALGLCHKFDQPEHDLGYGWEYDPVDLWSRDINYIEKLNPQMNFDFNYN